ncbi:MAG: ZPR1 zinc finger domain-containing protein [Thermoplasmatota archaeon]
MAAPSEQPVDAACPACQSTGLLLRTALINIPYFGEALETFLHCPRCGFRHADFLVLGEHEPVRWFIPISRATMEARVVRSSSGTWRIPELGFNAEPTALSESFITNVEGMLYRARDVIERAKHLNEDDAEKMQVAVMLMAKADRIAAGEEEATLVLEDPMGNSLIAHPAAERMVLSEEEARKLKSSVIILDSSDLADDTSADLGDAQPNAGRSPGGDEVGDAPPL